MKWYIFKIGVPDGGAGLTPKHISNCIYGYMGMNVTVLDASLINEGGANDRKPEGHTRPDIKGTVNQQNKQEIRLTSSIQDGGTTE